MQSLYSIEETSYLSAPNAVQYRTIMRIFYREYEKMHFQLYKEDILELLRRIPDFEDYDMEQLKLDLEALIRWKNLTPIQDPGKAYTIEEYKNKQYRYVMSEAYHTAGKYFCGIRKSVHESVCEAGEESGGNGRDRGKELQGNQ